MESNLLKWIRCHKLEEVCIRGCVISELKSSSGNCVWSKSMIEGTPSREVEALSIHPISTSLLQGQIEKEGRGGERGPKS